MKLIDRMQRLQELPKFVFRKMVALSNPCASWRMRLNVYASRFDEIPKFLSLLMVVLFVAGVFQLLAAVIPGLGGYRLDGTLLSYQQLWQFGYAYALIVSGALTLATAFGMWHRTAWARYLLVSFPGVQLAPFLLAHWLAGGPYSGTEFDLRTNLLVDLLEGIALAIYVFFAKSARRYFGKT